MKLATLKNGTRDGSLVMVDQNIKKFSHCSAIVPTLQAFLDDWDELYPAMSQFYQALNEGGLNSDSNPLDPKALESPLPRAYQWADGSAYVNHVELVRKARGAVMPENFWTDPLMYQGGSDDFIGPCDDIICRDESWGIDFEAEVAVVTGDVPMGVSPQEAGQYILLLMLVNDVSLRNLIPAELAKGFGFFQSKPSSSFSPLAVTPDELGDCWDGGKISLPLTTHLNGDLFGEPFCHVDMTFDFPTLISHAARSRNLRAGTIIGSGTISNLDRSRGSSCLAEKRMLEKIETGEMITPFMKHGDRVRIEMLNAQGNSVFGAIDQQVVIKD